MKTNEDNEKTWDTYGAGELHEEDSEYQRALDHSFALAVSLTWPTR